MVPGRCIDALEPAVPPATVHDTSFYDPYHQRAGELTRYLRRRGAHHDDADDLVSAVFLEAWRHREDLLAREPTCQRAWLYETAINYLRNHWRSQERRNRFLPRCPRSEGDPDIADALADAAEHMDQHRRFTRAVAGLSCADREVVKASISEDAGSTTLGQRLGISEVSARQRLSRARRRLVAALSLAGAAASTCWAVLERLDPWVVVVPL